MSYPKQQYFPEVPIPLPGSDISIMDIWKAIDFNNYGRVKQIIDEDKNKMTEKSWNEMMPIHHACLRGQLEIVQLLVESGTDINAGTSFEETPLHYACRAGFLPIVNWLCQKGANHKCKDKKGRTCMHFAALGNSLTVVHYLSTQLGHKYDLTDNTGQNALHICSERSNTIIYSYLLRDNRVDPSSSDLKGVTPLHIVAEKGNGEMAWMLLKAGKCGLLRLKNHANETPVKIAYCGKTDQHRKLAKQLEKLAKYPPEYELKGPRLQWLSALLMPFSTVTIVYFLSSYLNGNKGYFTFAFLLLMVGYLAKQSHRLNHISKRPNPIFMGFFFGGIVHCTIAQYYKIYPSIWPAPWHALISTTLVFLSYYMFYNLATTFYGVKRYPKLDPITGNELGVMDIAERKCKDFDFCPYTECIKHERAKYCKICEAIVIDLDHHCLFINNCVVGKNHRLFVLFIFVVMALQCLFMHSLYIYGRTELAPSENLRLSQLIGAYFYQIPWLASLGLLSILSLIWETALILSQLDVISRGQTTYSKMKHLHHAGPLTKKQRLQNVFNFFIKRSSNDKRRNIERVPLIMYA